MICIGFNNLLFVNDNEEKKKIENVFKKIFKKKDLKKQTKEVRLNNLIVKYQETKNDDVFSEIYEIYRPLIENMSRAKSTIDINYHSELNWALYNAVLNFNVNNKTNASFNTYFLKCANNQINVINNRLNAYRRKSNKNNLSLQANNSTADNKEATLEDIIEDTSSENKFKDIEFNMVLNKILNHLKEDEKKAIKLLINGYTLKEIGIELGNITAPAVFSKLKRLRKNKFIQKDLLSLIKG